MAWRACSSPPSPARTANAGPGRCCRRIGDAPDEVLVWLGHFDRFVLAQPDTYGLASLGPVIEPLQPDVVHIHHLLQFGVETIDLIRRAAPRARLIFTAHDFFPLCAQEGQLLTHGGPALPRPVARSPARRCFPGRSGADFVMRDLQMRDVLDDSTASWRRAPSPATAIWRPAGPARRFRSCRTASPTRPPAPHRAAPDGRRDRFGFFGHVNRFKGGAGAARRLAQLGAAASRIGVTLHGGAAYQSDEPSWRSSTPPWQAAPAARHHGPYAAAELPG